MGQKQGRLAKQEEQPQQLPINTPGVVVSPEKSELFKIERRSDLFDTFQIPDNVLQRCLHKVRNNEPIIFDIASHGSYDTKSPRVDIKNFLLTIASTGYVTYSDFIFDFLSPSYTKQGENVYDRYLPKMLNGNLAEIHKNENKLTNFMKRRKDYTNNNYIAKLYYGNKTPHFNKAGTQKRFTKTDKQAPPIMAQFTNQMGDPNQGNFIIEPNGIYLIEDSSLIARTYSRFRRGLHPSFNTENYPGVVRMQDYGELLEKLGKTDSVSPDSPDYRNHVRRMLINYYYSVGNPMFEFVKTNSVFIPHPGKSYRVSELMEAISQKLETELMKADPTIRNPVILFTFLQCKVIHNKEEIELFNRMSNARNKQDIQKVKRLYKDYVSPGMTPEQVNDLQLVVPADLSKSIKRISSQNKTQKKKASKKSKTRKSKSGQEEIMEGPAAAVAVIPSPTQCKGKSIEECIGPNCQWVNGNKRKYCKRRRTRKNK